MLNISQQPVTANLNAPMPSTKGLMKLVGNALKLNLANPCKQLLDILV